MVTIKLLTDGLRGFAVFFSVIIFIELFLYSFGFRDRFQIEIVDIYHSFIGSVVFLLNRVTKSILLNTNSFNIKKVLKNER